MAKVNTPKKSTFGKNHRIWQKVNVGKVNASGKSQHTNIVSASGSLLLVVASGPINLAQVIASGPIIKLLVTQCL